MTCDIQEERVPIADSSGIAVRHSSTLSNPLTCIMQARGLEVSRSPARLRALSASAADNPHGKRFVAIPAIAAGYFTALAPLAMLPSTRLPVHICRTGFGLVVERCRRVGRHESVRGQTLVVGRRHVVQRRNRRGLTYD